VNAVPRDASTVVVIRDASSGIELLMVRRTPTAQFMGGAWVFPGGAVDDADGTVASTDPELGRWRAAAVRELVEETGIWLLESGAKATTDRPSGSDIFSAVSALGDRFDAAALRYFARWITPGPLPIRFDARFYLAVVPRGIDPLIDGNELVDAHWARPREILERAADGSWILAFPTMKTVAFLDGFGSAADVAVYVDGMPSVRAIQPRLAVVGETVRILVPGDPGFDAAEHAEQNPGLMAKLLHVVAAGGDVPPDFLPA